jgi:CRM1 C terminal
VYARPCLTLCAVCACACALALQNVGRAPAVAQGFYQAYLLSLIQEILAAMTDMLHKSCFKQHAQLLRHMFHLTQEGQVSPLSLLPSLSLI